MEAPSTRHKLSREEALRRHLNTIKNSKLSRVR